MERPPLEVADIVRAAGQKFIERSRRLAHGPASESLKGDRTLPHGRSRLAC